MIIFLVFSSLEQTQFDTKKQQFVSTKNLCQRILSNSQSKNRIERNLSKFPLLNDNVRSIDRLISPDLFIQLDTTRVFRIILENTSPREWLRLYDERRLHCSAIFKLPSLVDNNSSRYRNRVDFGHNRGRDRKRTTSPPGLPPLSLRSAASRRLFNLFPLPPSYRAPPCNCNWLVCIIYRREILFFSLSLSS